jgi:hypothetical protein
MGEENIWRSSRSAVGGSDPATGDIAAPDPAVGLGAELALELHKAPNLGPVDSDIGLDVRGRLTDGGQVDAEEFGALLQRRGDRPRVGRVRFPSPHDDRLDEQVFEEQWNKAAKGNGLGISFKAYSLLASFNASLLHGSWILRIWTSYEAPWPRCRPVLHVRIREFLRLISFAPERQASVMRFLCEQSILGSQATKAVRRDCRRLRRLAWIRPSRPPRTWPYQLSGERTSQGYEP